MKDQPRHLLAEVGVGSKRKKHPEYSKPGKLLLPVDRPCLPAAAEEPAEPVPQAPGLGRGRDLFYGRNFLHSRAFLLRRGLHVHPSPLHRSLRSRSLPTASPQPLDGARDVEELQDPDDGEGQDRDLVEDEEQNIEIRRPPEPLHLVHGGPVLDSPEPPIQEHLRVRAKRRIEDRHDPDHDEPPEHDVPDPAGRQPHLPRPDQVEEERPEDQKDDRHILLCRHPETRGRPGKQRIPHLPPLNVVEEGDKQRHRKEGDVDIVPQEPREVDHIRRDRKEERCYQGLLLVQVAEFVDRIDQRDKQGAEERRKKPAHKIGVPEEREDPGRRIVEERPMVHGVVDIGPLGQEFVREPRVDSLIVVK